MDNIKQSVHNSGITFVTGGPGCGKSTLAICLAMGLCEQIRLTKDIPAQKHRPKEKDIPFLARSKVDETFFENLLDKRYAQGGSIAWYELFRSLTYCDLQI